MGISQWMNGNAWMKLDMNEWKQKRMGITINGDWWKYEWECNVNWDQNGMKMEPNENENGMGLECNGWNEMDMNEWNEN